MDVRRGDVVYVNLSPQVGSEQAGTRPLVVIQIDDQNRKLPTVIVVPFSKHQPHKALRESNVDVPAGDGGLAMRSVALCNQVRVIDKQRFISKLGTLSQAKLDEIVDRVAKLIGR